MKKRMDIEEIVEFCGQFPGVNSNFPFGPQPQCFRVGGRIFAQVFPKGVQGALGILLCDESIPREKIVPMVTLSCNPAYGDFWRRQYPGIVVRPYHSPPAQQPYANTVLLTGQVPTAEMKEMIHHAYNQTLQKLPKQKQREITEMKQGEF